MNDIKLTVFTPTFNREKNLNKCYESLVEQTSKDFIWQVIDDGSTDQTERIIERFKEENLINIVYIKKQNGGKASAINLSLEKCLTELWVCLDSDDFFTEDAIKIMLENYESIKLNDKICGLIALRSNPDLKPMHNKHIPGDVKYTTLRTIRYEMKIQPEYAFIFKTNIISKYPYPIIKNEKFMPLSYVFDQIDQLYNYKVIHDPIMICEYYEDGITRNKTKLIRRNPLGYTLYKRQALHYAPNIKIRIKECISYIAGSILSRDCKFIRKTPHKILTFFCYPLGWFMYLTRFRDK